MTEPHPSLSPLLPPMTAVRDHVEHQWPASRTPIVFTQQLSAGILLDAEFPTIAEQLERDMRRTIACELMESSATMLTSLEVQWWLVRHDAVPQRMPFKPAEHEQMPRGNSLNAVVECVLLGWAFPLLDTIQFYDAALSLGTTVR